ncbi:AI-2E family transporter [Candidatus Woesearchaeota archaeon]|nr:AI-2E family transporter [Candidatus Woesearchaeota archaeon]
MQCCKSGWAHSNPKRGAQIKRKTQVYIFFLVGVVLAYFAYKLVAPYLIPILGSIVAALLIFPVYRWFNKKYVKNKSLASLIIVIVFILLIGIPAGFLINAFAREAYSAYIEAKKLVSGGAEFECTKEGAVCNFVHKIEGYTNEPQFQYYIQEAGKRVSSYLLAYGQSFILAIPGKLVDLFIFFFFLYYFLRDGKYILERIRNFLPLRKNDRDNLVRTTKGIIYAILYGTFVTAVIQGIVGGLGFWVLGLNSPVFWAIIMAFFALLPIGAGIVWVPASLYLVAFGLINDQNSMIIKGVILFAYGLLVISTIDNLIRPKLISGHTKVHPLIIITGLIGGLAMFGFVGLFIGPLILTLLIAIFEIMKEAEYAV